MPSPRWLAGLAVPMMVGAALVTNSAIATADPTNDANLDPTGANLLQVGSMVNLARSTYCANQRCWAPHC
jgi:hypothetical protein